MWRPARTPQRKSSPLGVNPVPRPMSSHSFSAAFETLFLVQKRCTSWILVSAADKIKSLSTLGDKGMKNT